MPKIKPLVCPKCGVEIAKYRMYYTVPSVCNYEFDCPNCLVKVTILDKYTQKVKVLDNWN